MNHPQITAKLDHVYGFVVRLTFTNISDKEAWLYPPNSCAGGKIGNNVFIINDGEAVVGYSGRMVKRRAPVAEDFDSLASHTSRSVDVDLLRAYKLVAGVAYSVHYHGFHNDPRQPGVLLVVSPSCVVKA
jgi:hypothetical protein